MKRGLSSPSARRADLDRAWSPWRSRPLADLLGVAAARFPDRPLVLGEEPALTYAEADKAVGEMAAGLSERGIVPGDRVGLLMANGPEFVVAKLAIARAGAIAVPLNVALGVDELGFILGQSAACALIAMARFRERDYLADLTTIADRLPGLRFVAVHGDAIPATMLPLAEIVGDPGAGLPAVDPGALSDIIYTSGTTGRPKGVMLTHEMVVRTGYASARVRALVDGARLCFVSPLYHVHGYVECLVAAMIAGGAIVPQRRFDPEAMLALAERHAATEISGVPTMTRRLLEAAERSGFDADALICVFNTGGLNTPDIWPAIRRLLQPNEIVTAYGMSETTASTVCTLPEDPDAVLVAGNGKPKDAGISSAAGEPLAEYRLDAAVGGVGELQVRGAQVTPGYWDNLAETEAAFTGDGWLKTGDLGRIDSDGTVAYVGRSKEAYRCGGELVMPREVETVIEEDAAVAQVFVVGVPDPRMEEVGCACIVPIAGAAIDPEAVRARCAARLARFKVPRHVLVFAADEIPLTATLRPQKFRLVALAIERLERAAREDGGELQAQTT